MKRLVSYIKRWFGTMFTAFADEFRLTLRDWGVLIFFFLLPVAYPIIYTLIYNPEVVTEIPVAVVDHDRTADSRELVRTCAASPAIQIYTYCSDIPEAKRLMADGKVYGVLEIPKGYAHCLGSAEQAIVQFYSDASLLLRYRTFTAALSDIQLEMASEITAQRIKFVGMDTGESVLPISSRCTFLGDSEQGFASFVIPGIVVLILQQSMLLGICMIWGTRRERLRRGQLLSEDNPKGKASAIVWGRALATTFMYIPCTIYVLHFIPWMFRLPHYAALGTSVLFMFPLLLGSAFLGQSIGPLMRERESGFMYIVFVSPMLLFLSGLTWPRYAMSWFWRFIGDLIPATWGVEGFVLINSNASTLYDVRQPYCMMWILAAIFYVTAVLMQRRYMRRVDRLKD